MIKDMNDPINIFLSLVIGALTGEYLGLHKKFEKFASRFDVEGEQSVGGSFIKATMLFCVGGMTLIGCMNEGLDGDYNLIMVKSIMDLISSFFLASALGSGVLLLALGLDLIGLKKFQMLDLVPALAVLPIIHIIHIQLF